jgi:hypothetical protein
VLSVLGRDAEAMDAIRREISAGGEISFGGGTWFYVSRAIADDWRFWELLLQNAEQILGLMLPSCVEGESPVWPTGARVRNCRLSVRARKAALTLHFARATNRTELLDQLTAMYPEWQEPRLLLRWHAKQRRMPQWHELGDVSEWMRRNRR